MTIMLNVPFSGKDIAKQKGARWNPDKKKWYIRDKDDINDFIDWIEPNYNIAVYNNLYLMEGKRICFRCKKETTVICFGLFSEEFGDYAILDDEDRYFDYEGDSDDYFRFFNGMKELPLELADYLRKEYNFYYGYSKFADDFYFGNHCKHCDVLQGDFMLFNEPDDTPFFFCSYEDFTRIVVRKFPIQSAILFAANCNEEYDFVQKYIYDELVQKGSDVTINCTDY